MKYMLYITVHITIHNVSNDLVSQEILTYKRSSSYFCLLKSPYRSGVSSRPVQNTAVSVSVAAVTFKSSNFCFELLGIRYIFIIYVHIQREIEAELVLPIPPDTYASKSAMKSSFNCISTGVISLVCFLIKFCITLFYIYVRTIINNMLTQLLIFYFKQLAKLFSFTFNPRNVFTYASVYTCIPVLTFYPRRRNHRRPSAFWQFSYLFTILNKQALEPSHTLLTWTWLLKKNQNSFLSSNIDVWRYYLLATLQHCQYNLLPRQREKI